MTLSELRLSISLLRRYLRTNSIQEKKVEMLKRVIDDIRDYIPISNSSFTPSQLVRVTINKKIPDIGNNRIYEIKHLKYPPEESVTRYGRCNLINQSVLYGAFTGLTSSKEMKPEIGDLITTTTWKMKDGYALNVCPIFYITSLDGKLHNEISLRFKIAYENFLNKKYAKNYHPVMNYLMEFLAQSYSKEVDEKNNFDYFLSAYLSDVIFKYPTANIDTIIYPSVQDYLDTSNMAIKPDVFNEKFYPAEIQEGILTSIFPVITSIGTNWSRQFDEKNGKIIWYK